MPVTKVTRYEFGTFVLYKQANGYYVLKDNDGTAVYLLPSDFHGLREVLDCVVADEAVAPLPSAQPPKTLLKPTKALDIPEGWKHDLS